MGKNVHLHVCFACDANEEVAALAGVYLAALPADSPHECRWFLDALARRHGPNPGPKGGLSLWGVIGNYTCVEQFVAVLVPFWVDLLTRNLPTGPLDFEHILVFEEQEQAGHAIAHDIAYDARTQTLRIHRHVLPFAWRQF